VFEGPSYSEILQASYVNMRLPLMQSYLFDLRYLIAEKNMFRKTFYGFTSGLNHSNNV